MNRHKRLLYLIEDQPEYFYRSYIDFTLAHQFDLTPALRCFVEHSDEFKDVFIYMSFEMDLKFATCTFNDPDQMLDDVKILLDEGLYNPIITHPEERIWAGQTPRVPGAPKIKHDKMKQFYMIDIERKRW